MKYSFILCFLFFSVPVFSQLQVNVFHQTADTYLLPEEIPFHYVLADNVSLRNEPSGKGKIISPLKIGSKLILKERSEHTISVDGISSHWYKVETEGKTGWIWGGMIAQQTFGSFADPLIKFVMGEEKVVWAPGDTAYEHIIQIRAFRNNKQLDKISLKVPTIQNIQIDNFGNRGMINLEDIISLNITCNGAIGCVSGNIYVFWNKLRFYHVADMMGIPDHEQSNYSRFIFPTDMEGQPLTIIKITSSFIHQNQYCPEEIDYCRVDRKVVKEFFKWEGSRLLDKGTKPEIKVYTIEMK